jgi:hypothetical protein
MAPTLLYLPSGARDRAHPEGCRGSVTWLEPIAWPSIGVKGSCLTGTSRIEDGTCTADACAGGLFLHDFEPPHEQGRRVLPRCKARPCDLRIATGREELQVLPAEVASAHASRVVTARL